MEDFFRIYVKFYGGDGIIEDFEGLVAGEDESEVLSKVADFVGGYNMILEINIKFEGEGPILWQ